MPLPKQVKIVEVSPRDGLQNEPKPIPTELKQQLIEQLAQSGLQQIEITSYVSPKWVPQLADHHLIARNIKPKAGVSFVALTPNMHGLENALDDGVNHIAVFTAASETFSKKNTNSSIEESLLEIEKLIQAAKAKCLRVRGYISCVMGCPYEGDIDVSVVCDIANRLHTMGCDEISLGDTIGVGTPQKTQTLIVQVTRQIPLTKIAVHFHDTYGQALANIYASLTCGVSIIDSSAAGLGGCPYAPGAGGNVATEDVLFLCLGLGIETGVDINAVTQAGKQITDYLGIIPRSKAAIAIQAAADWSANPSG